MSINNPMFEFFNVDLIHDCFIAFDSPYIKNYQLSPKWGKGFFQTIDLGKGASMAIVDCCLSQNHSYSIQDTTLIHIAYFNEIHCTTCCPCCHCTLTPDTFYCQTGLCGNFETVYQKESPIKAIHIFLTPEYYETYFSEHFPQFNFSLKEATALLNGETHLPELACIFHQLHNYNRTNPSALLFYYSKLNEILARILQRTFEEQSNLSHPVRQTDCVVIQSIAEYICNHLAEDTSLDCLSHMACMSSAKLKYIFKSVFHCSIRDFRLKKRIEIAEKLLCNTDCGICEIACRLGYQTAGSFSDIFKKHTGVSPKSYRTLYKTAPDTTSAATF